MLSYFAACSNPAKFIVLLSLKWLINLVATKVYRTFVADSRGLYRVKLRIPNHSTTAKADAATFKMP